MSNSSIDRLSNIMCCLFGDIVLVLGRSAAAVWVARRAAVCATAQSTDAVVRHSLQGPSDRVLYVLWILTLFDYRTRLRMRSNC